MTTGLELTNPRCEYRTNPLGIDTTQPRLSWELQGERRGITQRAYRIVAAPSEAALADNHNLLWDSGRVEGGQSAHIAYAGAPLASGQRVYWQVTVWDDAGTQAQSAPAWWEMGLLQRSDWQAAWVGAPFLGGPRTTSPAPFLRKTFSVTQTVAAARLYVTALGLYEAHLNGARVGEDVLTPGWTEYAKHLQYQVYDVSSLLRPGDNVLGAILGDGWAVGFVSWQGRQNYADRPLLLAQLVVTYDDGSSETITTDTSWKVTTGPILESDMLMGESYDARRELPGWDAPGYDDASWAAAQVFADTDAALVATNGPTVRRQEELRPIALHDQSEFMRSRWIFDLGQNMVGWVRLRVSGPAGTTITLRYAEVLDADGSVYTTNLRSARNTDHYTLKGEGEEVWEPRFLFHGFRYVELNEFPGTPTHDTITGIVVHSAMPATGSFSCSDALLNQLQHNIAWGQKGNFVDVPTDCPQRDERLGWTGDAQVFIRTAAFNYDVAGFFTKWLRDVADAQSPEGAYPMVVPNPGLGPDGGPAWADAGVICPWTIYECYGDTRLLAECYPSMQRFVGFLQATSRDGLRCYPEYQGWHGFGDWLALDGSADRFGITPKELIGTAFFSHSARLLARIATILGRSEDAARYHSLADTARDAFCQHFVTPDGLIAGGTQTCYVLALHFDLLPPQARATALAALARDVERRGMHLSTGFVGTPYLNWVLTEGERLDLAYALLKQTTWPSWLYSVTQGATTIWERWDGWTHDKGFQDAGMNSFNHYAYGAIGAWMYAVVGGIDLDPAQPGYKHIKMRPRPGGGVTQATTELHSIYGPIRSAWTLEGDTFDWQITVPANTTATVYVPTTHGAIVREGDHAADEASGVRFVQHENGAAVYEVGSGAYHFTATT